MFIKENITDYEVTLYHEDLLVMDQTMEQIVANLQEASGLVGKPLGEYRYTYNPKDMSWVIIIKKEF